MNRVFGLILFLASFALCATAEGRDWIHWRGPEENGVSRETGLPDSFDPKRGAKGNVVWQQPFGGRAAPLVMDGKLYLFQGNGSGTNEGEQVVCFDEKSGKPLWTHRINVFHTDIVSSRLGWTTLAADPATKTVFAHTTGGDMLCLDSTGKLLWSHNLTEEFGRITGYGGRIASPIFDSGLVIVGFPNTSWGDQGAPRSRFVAFDGKTGEIVWWVDTGNQLKGTYASTPVIAVINGQRLLITGGADGYLHAFKARSGEKVWSYRFSGGIINPSPIVDGNLVYCSHGENNPEPGELGRVICVDAGTIVDKSPKLVWEHKNLGRFGLACGAVADGRYYVPEDSGTLFCFDGKTGKKLWSYKYGKEVRGAPLIADGKLYIFDVQGRMSILTLNEDRNKAPDPDESFEYKFKDPKGFLVETNGTPIAVNGRVYFNTRTDLYCIADAKSKGECGKYKELAAETKYDPTAAPTAARIFPVDVTAKAGEQVRFQIVLMDANGRVLKSKAPDAKAEWSLALPPKTPAGLQPPALKGKIEGDFAGATLTLDSIPPGQQSYVDFKSGKFNLRARVRVVPQLPYKQDFTAIPDGALPGGWVNAQGKYYVKEMPDKNKVLFKVNNNSVPGIARTNAYMTMPDATNYTIQADVMGTEVRRKMADIGLVNCRYLLMLDGKTNPESGKREVRFTTWEARAGGRINTAVDFNWEPGVWYTAKFSIEQKEKTALLRAKVWKKADPEPAKWTIEYEDSTPNRNGAAALYGYVSNVGDGNLPGAECFYDNVLITPNGKK